MTTRPLYPKGRASALWSTRRPDYDLIAHLRNVRASGDEAMRAAEEYDPNFGLKLSACFDKNEADRLLDDWLSHRVAVPEAYAIGAPAGMGACPAPDRLARKYVALVRY